MTAHQTHAAPLGLDGPPLEHQGRLYRCRPLDQRAKGELERRLVALAMRAAALAPPECRGEACAAVAAEAAGGAYGFYGARSQAALGSAAGLLALAATLFGVGEDEALALLDARPEECKALLHLAVLESLPAPLRERALAAAREREAGGDANPTPAP
jgi:hypothetical protein